MGITLRAIGLLGGSFDPPHTGHLALARAARDNLSLSAVRFIPAASPWQKRQVTDASHRAQMTALAIRGEPQFALDLHEIERGGPSYTVQTLAALRESLGAEVPLVWIIGGDQMQRLDTWFQWERLLDFAHLAIARRNEAALQLNDRLQSFYNEHQAPPSSALMRAHGHLFDLAMPPMDVSATALRQLLACPAEQLTESERDQLRTQLSPAVLDYIRAQHLYH